MATDLLIQKAVGFEIKHKFASNCEDFTRAVYEEQGKMYVFSFDSEYYDRVLKRVDSILALEAGEAIPHKRMVGDYTSFPWILFIALLKQAMFPKGTSNCVEDCIILAMVAVDR